MESEDFSGEDAGEKPANKKTSFAPTLLLAPARSSQAADAILRDDSARRDRAPN